MEDVGSALIRPERSSRNGSREPDTTPHSAEHVTPQRGDGRPSGRGQRGRGERRGNRGRRPQIRGGSEQQRTRNPYPRPAIPHSHSSRREDQQPSNVNDSTKNKEADGDEPEAEICFICASNVVHQSVAPCNHRTCHICALRLRALYKTRACAHCRTESPFVIFTDDCTKRYEDFEEADFQKVDDALGIKYEKLEIHDDTVLLLRYNCPDESCDIACYGWPDLHRHVKSVHHKVMCDLCTRNKKVFTHEHELFTVQELRKHEKFGDDNPGALDQSGFKGHPECGFCRRRFYGDDELYVHCREKHERCHICDRRNNGRSQQYYVDYNALEAHFRKGHFLCMDQDCLDKKFVVFESEMDLKAHQLEMHPGTMSKDVRREARTVNMALFDYRTPHQEERGRSSRGRGRGRDPNANANPPLSTQHLTREEIAFQRQMAIQSAQSVSTRTFGGQLTAQPVQGPPPTSVTFSASSSDSTSLATSLNNLRVNSDSPAPGQQTRVSQPLNPREEARRLQHQGVIDRAAALLKNDATKVETFKSRVSAYRNSIITASELIDTFFSLFDVSSADLSKLIKELADLYETESKRADLLKAWNDWRAINEDYPSLPGPSGTAVAPSTGSGGRRILRLKSSTAKSNRSATSKQTSWGGLPAFSTNALAAPSAGWPNAFPSLPPAGPSARTAVAPWITDTASSRSSDSPARSRVAPVSGPTTTEAFPELPKAAKPNTHIFGKHHGAVRWNDGPGSGPSSNAWQRKTDGNATESAQPSEAEADEQDSKAAGGKKKGKKGKEVLYKFG